MSVHSEQTRPISDGQTRPSGVEPISEVSDLAAGAGILVFTLAPFALPALLMMAVVAVALAIPPLVVGAILAAPILLTRRWRRSRDRTTIARRGHDEHRAPQQIERERQARRRAAGLSGS